MKIKKIIALAAAVGMAATVAAQGIAGGHVTGNVQMDAQMSRADSVIGASDVTEKLLMNARADILYTNGDFSGGIRFEMYQNPLLGFDPEYKGQGLANYFVAYNGKRISITAGYFYEQFGSGLILRTYEDRYLGLDNALLGLNLTLRPIEGVTIKALTGKQRVYWNLGEGIVRGIDGEVNLTEAIKAMQDSKFRAIVGAGFVSRFQQDETDLLPDDPEYKLKLPLNVGAASVRATLGYGGWNLDAEYARKGQDPNAINDYIYHYGKALMLNLNYSQRGFSAGLQAKRIDNMGFKSDRNSSGEMLYINYLPAITKNHTYALLTMYPYATQVMGEQGIQGDMMWKAKKGTWLGGKYGMDIHLNSSVVCALNKDSIGGMGTDGYNVKRGLGGLYYSDASLEVSRKLSKSVKLTATYAYQVFNPAVENEARAEWDMVHNNIVIGDLSWKVNKKHSLRFEAEWMGSDSYYDASSASHIDRRFGDWLMALVEWNIGSNWFVSASEQWPYNDGIGNYYNISAGYTSGSTRLQVGYGKQREGMICIGGVCRPQPAVNGFSISLTTSF